MGRATRTLRFIRSDSRDNLADLADTCPRDPPPTPFRTIPSLPVPSVHGASDPLAYVRSPGFDGWPTRRAAEFARPKRRSPHLRIAQGGRLVTNAGPTPAFRARACIRADGVRAGLLFPSVGARVVRPVPAFPRRRCFGYERRPGVGRSPAALGDFALVRGGDSSDGFERRNRPDQMPTDLRSTLGRSLGKGGGGWPGRGPATAHAWRLRLRGRVVRLQFRLARRPRAARIL